MDSRTIHVHVLCIHAFSRTTRVTSAARKALALPAATTPSKGSATFSGIKNLFDAAFSRTAQDAQDLSLVMALGTGLEVCEDYLEGGVHWPRVPHVLAQTSLSLWETFVHELSFLRDMLAWRSMTLGLPPLTSRLSIELRVIHAYLFPSVNQLSSHVPRGGTVSHVRGQMEATLYSLSGFASTIENAHSYDRAGTPLTLSVSSINDWIQSIKNVMETSGLSAQVTEGLRREIESAQNMTPFWSEQYQARWAFNRLMSRVCPRYTPDDQRALLAYITGPSGEQTHAHRVSSSEQ